MRKQLTDHQIDANQLDVAVVTFTAARNLNGYQRRFAPGMTVISDPDRSLYAIAGFERGSWWRIWGHQAARRYFELLRQGTRVQQLKRGEDTLQLGGNVLLDGNGIVTWKYSGAGPDDRPSADEVLAAVLRVRSNP